MAIKTNRSDVISNFVRYHGRQPTEADQATITYLTTKSPPEVEKLLAKDSPVTGGKLWGDYQAGLRVNLKKPQEPAKPTVKTEVTGSPTSQTRTLTEKPLELRPEQKIELDKAYARQLAGKSTPTDDANIAYAEKTFGYTYDVQAEEPSPEEAVVNDSTDSWVDEQVAAGTISAEEGVVIKETLNANDFTSGTAPDDATMAKMLEDAKVIAQESLDPYYKKQTAQELSDLKSSIGDIRSESLRHQQQEALSYADTLAKSKQSLRARGLTFSGTSTAQLGSESALVNQYGIEGTIPQQRRYDWEDKSADWQERARDIGMAAERELGSGEITSNADYLNLRGVADPYSQTQGKTPKIGYTAGETGDLYLGHKDKTQPDYVANGRLQLERLKEIDVAANKAIEKKKII